MNMLQEISKQNWVVFHDCFMSEGRGSVVKIGSYQGAPIVSLLYPYFGSNGEERQCQRATAVAALPDLIRLAMDVVAIGEGNAPSVGYCMELIEKAHKILIKINTEP